MSSDLENLVRLIESLSSEMQSGFADLKARFDRQDARLERHGGLLQGGARATTRMIEWSERADQLWTDRDERLRQLEERVRRLEQR